MRPIIPTTVPTISAVVKLLLFDEFGEPVTILDDGELDVADFDIVKDEVGAVWVPAPEGENVGVTNAALENDDGDIELDVVVMDLSEVPVCCAAPTQREGGRVNTVLKRSRFGAKAAHKRQRQHLLLPDVDNSCRLPLIGSHNG